MVEFKRKKGESFESFYRRFNRSLRKSRKLNIVRANKYTSSKKNKNQQKEYALASNKLREKRDYLKKTGKLKEEVFKRW